MVGVIGGVGGGFGGEVGLDGSNVGSVVGKHVGGGYQSNRTGDFGTINLEARSLYTLTAGRWRSRCRSISPFDALGESACERHNVN